MLKKLTAFLLAISCFLAIGTGCQTHTHVFDKKVNTEAYLKTAATCVNAAQYYYSCECGEKGEETYSTYRPLAHNYTAKVKDDKYLKTAATCKKGGQYYYSCTGCGAFNTLLGTFYDNELGDHVYDCENPDVALLKDEATHQSPATYFKSCVCGAKGKEFFSYGDPLKTYTESEKVPYKPVSLTISLYDTTQNLYGITYNTQSKPLRPVVQVAKGNSLDNYVEYDVHTEKHVSLSTNDKQISYYVAKAEFPLENNSTYTYRVYDKYVDIGSQTITFTTKDLTANKFSFAHFSDSQVSGKSTGEYLAKILDYSTKTTDFTLHTGDIVEYSCYEQQWTDIIDSNFNYFSKTPVMALSGNHETTYQNGSKEIFKHFNNAMPTQSVNLGYYYSFTYGNAKFIMLNTNELMSNKLTNAQYDWLVNELKSNDKQWLFVALHNPIYSVGNYGANPSRNQICLALRSQLHDLFVEYGVDIVFQGHDHLVSRTFPMTTGGNASTETWRKENGVNYTVNPDGVLYVMNGPAGNQSRTVYENDNGVYYYAKNSEQCSWAEISIDGNKLVMTTKYVNNSTEKEYQTWGIIKE